MNLIIYFSILKVDDFQQDYELMVTILDKPDCKEFEVIADAETLKPKNENGTNGNGAGKYILALYIRLKNYLTLKILAKDYDDPQPSSSKKITANDDNDSDMEIVEDEQPDDESNKTKKQKLDSEDMPQAKKPKLCSESNDMEIVDLS